MGVGKIHNTLKVKDLLKNIGKKKSWSEKDVENDIFILERNRILTVNDLKSLSRESWAQIELLPLVKDLLRTAIDPNWLENEQYQTNDKQVEERREKKEKKKDKKKSKNKEKKGDDELGEPVVPVDLSKEQSSEGLLCEDPLTIENTIKNGTVSGLSEIDGMDDSESETDDDEPVSPSTTNVPVRRKSVTFSDEKTFIDDPDNEKKKDKKKNKKKKPSMLITNNSGYNNFKSHPYTSQPVVKFKKLKTKHAKRIPPAPENDSFLQGLHDKLMANHIGQS